MKSSAHAFDRRAFIGAGAALLGSAAAGPVFAGSRPAKFPLTAVTPGSGLGAIIATVARTDNTLGIPTAPQVAFAQQRPSGPAPADARRIRSIYRPSPKRPWWRRATTP